MSTVMMAPDTKWPPFWRDDVPLAMNESGDVTWWRGDQFARPEQVRQAMADQEFSDGPHGLRVSRVYIRRVPGPQEFPGMFDNWWAECSGDNPGAIRAWRVSA